ncbi:hypothetical protein ACLOJK_004888 [Asimina triloba]
MAPYGENIFWGSDDGWTPGQAVAAWLLERKWYLHGGGRKMRETERKWYLLVQMRGGRRGRKMREEDESASSRPGEDGETSAGDEGGGARFVISNVLALNALTAVGLVGDSVL